VNRGCIDSGCSDWAARSGSRERPSTAARRTNAGRIETALLGSIGLRREKGRKGLCRLFLTLGLVIGINELFENFIFVGI